MRMLFILLLLLPLVTFADTHPANTVVIPTISMHPEMPHYEVLGLTFYGFASGSYNYLSQSPRFTSGYPDRLYDTDKNGFILQEASITLSRLPEYGLGFLLNPTLGRDVYELEAYGMRSWIDSQNLALDLTQAYLQYARNSLTLLGGKYYGLEGYESIPPLNSNFSSSYLATYAEPTTVSGMRMVYALNSLTNIALGVNDGWDSVTDWGKGKTVEMGMWYADSKTAYSMYVYQGHERATLFTNTGPIGIRTSLDLIALTHINDKLTLVANYDYVTQSRSWLSNGTYNRAHWQGIATYLQYQFNSKWRLSMRCEYFIDANGFVTGIAQNLKEITLTAGYLIAKNLELRAETRRDISSTNSFQNMSGTSTSHHMQSFALNAVATL